MKDTIKPAIGPAIPKSKSAFVFGGGDLRGVIAPVVPVVMEGITLGKPASNCKEELLSEDKDD